MPRLKLVARDDLTVRRKRSGRGFSFVDANRLPVSAEIRERALALVIPPAWTEVRVAADANAHIQCIGIDEAGRVQYIYHLDWEKKRNQRKQLRLALLTAALPRIRRRVAEDLRKPAGSLDLALAIAVALIDRTAMRVGRERYLEANGTRGAGTLYSKDVTINGDEVCLAFPAKSGKAARYCLIDPALSAAVSAILTLPGRRLLAYRTEAGKVVAIKTDAINAYLRQISGVEISAKDFRTLHASAMAGEALAKLERGTTEQARKRQMASVTKAVSEYLRNTPMVCRKSYVAPCLFKLFDTGKLSGLWNAAGTGGHGVKAREAKLGRVLEAVL
ncbi:MAG: hypothetical protein JWR75_959 [Devosia sp.]|nr:hypothetical protein [Devosia sp.]